MKDSQSFLLLLILFSALAGAAILPALAQAEYVMPEERLLPVSDTINAPDAADPATSLEKIETLSRQMLRPLAAENLGPVPLAPQSIADTNVLAGCEQLLVNTALDVVILDDESGSGTAEPWAPIVQNVYYDDRPGFYMSPSHSLLLVIGDEDWGLAADDTPEIDAFAQAVYMPDRLTSITIDYAVAMTNTFTVDHAYGSLYLVDETGVIDFDEGFVGSWEVSEAPGYWDLRTVMITDTTSLQMMNQQRVALILWNQSEIPTFGEIVWFDDIMLTACWAEGPSASKTYLPSMAKAGEREPLCVPPSENPPDVWNVPSTRGYVEPQAVCNTTMSQLDPKDYYTFVAPQTRNYRFSLRDLPAGTEWSLTVFVDQSGTPPIADGGACRTTQPGDGNKQVTCSLTGGQSYFIKISAGTYSGPAAGYEMQITTP